MLALLSNVHANLEALQACLAHARAEGAERVALLGDLAGYGADPLPVIDLAQRCIAEGGIAVRGNHDAAIESAGGYLNGAARAAGGPRLPFRAAAGGRRWRRNCRCLHELHMQGAIHLDLKPDNVILRPDGSAVLLDFGLAHHMRFPDLLAEERRFAAGSAPYISPEQVRGMRSDPRSDLFALGAVLYEMATGRLPFGAPRSQGSLHDPLWREPAPPRALVPGFAPWLQEIILRCLEVDPRTRYQSAAHVAFDLRHPWQVALTAPARRDRAPGLAAQLGRWWRSRHVVSAEAEKVLGAAPVILAAVDTVHPDDERRPALQRTIAQVLRLSREFRVIGLAVIPGGPGAAPVPLDHLARLRQWMEPFGLSSERLSLHRTA